MSYLSFYLGFLLKTTVSMDDFKMYPDSVLLNKKEMAKALFLENVENPKKTVHYTGRLCDYGDVRFCTVLVVFTRD
jgi:hypothetical protein